MRAPYKQTPATFRKQSVRSFASQTVSIPSHAIRKPPIDIPEGRTKILSTMKTLLTNLLVALLLIAGAHAQSNSQFFVKIQDINGESTVQGHANEIDVFSFKLGVSQKGITDFGGGAAAGKAMFLPVVIHKNVDISSPQLFLACVGVKVFL